ncbi:MAG: MFS transporter [Chloroflexota bacterium]|nr:MFS transporter [Chloroflexota bacterium]
MTRSDERQLTVLGYGAYGLLGWSSVLLPSLIVPIQDAFGRGDSAFGLVYFFGALLYGLGALGGGFLTERLGPRIVLTGAFVLLAASMLGGGALTIWVLFAATVSIGKAANGAIDAGFGALFLQAFAERRGSALSLLHLCYSVGALLAPLLIGIALTIGVHWRVVFGVTLAASLVALAGIRRLSWTEPAPDLPNVAAEPGEITAAERSLRPFVFLALAMGLYEAQVVGITAWIVRYLEDAGIGIATAALSAFWVGVCISRFLAPWLTARTTSTRLGLTMLTGTTILFTLALLSSWSPLTLGLLVIAGFLSGPIYPLLIAIGGDLYPHRLGRLSGGMTAAATIGALSYPPLIGVISTEWSLRAGLIGAALLGAPAVIALAAAVRSHLAPGDVGSGSARQP